MGDLGGFSTQPVRTQKSKAIWATLDLDLNVAKGKRGIEDNFL
jgi:hypothetical protein